MRNLAFYMFSVVILLTLTNCSDEIEFNNPAIQANKNGDFWRASYQAVDIDNGGWVIEGGNYVETVQLITFNDTRGTFELGGENNPNIAIFRDAQGVVYSTANEPNPELSVYPAEGVIIVDDITNDDPKRIRGTFWFTAYSNDGTKAINFNQGVFYMAPIIGGLVQIQ